MSFTSGAAKRKRKQAIEESLNKLPKISSFFSSEVNNEVVVSNENCTEPSSSNINSGEFLAANLESYDNQNESTMNVNVLLNPKEIDAVKVVERNCDVEMFDDSKEYPTDFTHFSNVDISNNSNLKKLIINFGLCRPKGVFPKDFKNTSFSDHYYFLSDKNEDTTTWLQTSNNWLCYSKIIDKAYCQPCWLFATTKSNWTTGINDWQGLTKKIQHHLLTQVHITCCFIYDSWRQNRVLDKSHEELLKKETDFWRQVLDRLFNITLTLSRRMLSFRGRRENFDSTDSYNGNFLSLVHLIAKYDSILQNVLERPKGSIKYLSPKIQNDIIHCLRLKLENSILSKIRSAPFFAIIMDTTQDIIKVDQLSKVIRYNELEKNDRGEVTKIFVRESFLGFTKVESQKAEGLPNDIINSLHSMQLDINKCRGQGYDGANVMSGPYSGVQKRISEIEQTALYMHCLAHRVNLVINDAVKSIAEISVFFVVLESIYLFFGSSIVRWDLLLTFKESDSTIKLKRLNPSRWSDRLKSLTAVRFRHKDIVMALNKIILVAKKSDERNEAKIILKNIENFEFIFLCVFLGQILEELNTLSTMAQNINANICEIADYMQKTLAFLAQTRNSYDCIKEEAEKIAKLWNVKAEFKSKRQSTVKKHFDELCEDHRLSNEESRFKINIFYRVIDIISTQLSERLS